jgi:hypothetical protein
MHQSTVVAGGVEVAMMTSWTGTAASQSQAACMAVFDRRAAAEASCDMATNP